MVGYFGVNAYTGKYGLNARQELDQEIIALTSELARLKKRAGRRASSGCRCCGPDRVDPDMLDERARFQLDYANPRDLVRINKSEAGRRRSRNFKNTRALSQKCRAALHCGIAKFHRANAILPR